MASRDATASMFVLLTGAGYTGRRILSMLPENAVAALGRSRADTDRQQYSFDLDSDRELPLELPPRLAVIYTVPPTGEPPDQRLQRFLGLVSPTRFVYISTTGVYGDHGGQTVTERSALNPSSQQAASRVAAEKLLTDWSREHDVALVILRAPGIYGPGRLGTERLRAGAPVIAAAEANPGNRIHVDDLARCCVAALDADVPAGVYNVGDGDHRSSTAFTNEVARQLDLPAPPQISRAEATQQFSPQRMAFLSDSRRVDTTKMREVLGVKPRYARPEDGIRASLSAS